MSLNELDRRTFLKFSGVAAANLLLPHCVISSAEASDKFKHIGPWKDIPIAHNYPIRILHPDNRSASWKEVDKFSVYGCCPGYVMRAKSGEVVRLDHGFSLKPDASEVVGIVHIVRGLVYAAAYNPSFKIREQLESFGLERRHLVDAAIRSVLLREDAGISPFTGGSRYVDANYVVDYNREVKEALTDPDKYGTLYYLLNAVVDSDYDPHLCGYSDKFCRRLKKSGVPAVDIPAVSENLVDLFGVERFFISDDSLGQYEKLGEKIEISKSAPLCCDAAAIAAFCLANALKEFNDVDVNWTSGTFDPANPDCRHAWVEVFRNGKIVRVINPSPVDGYIFSTGIEDRAAMIMNNGSKVVVEARLNVSEVMRRGENGFV